jgi:hypothetical protein
MTDELPVLHQLVLETLAFAGRRAGELLAEHRASDPVAPTPIELGTTCPECRPLVEARDRHASTARLVDLLPPGKQNLRRLYAVLAVHGRFEYKRQDDRVRARSWANAPRIHDEVVAAWRHTASSANGRT